MKEAEMLNSHYRRPLSQVRAVPMTAAACLVVAMSLLASAAPAAAEPCPNEQIRIQQGTTGLPDCRAYEPVSRANNHDTGNIAGAYGFPEGEHVYYKSFLTIPGEEARSGLIEHFLATRTAAGWRQQAISIPQGKAPPTVTLGVQTNVEPITFSSDFSQAFLSSPYQNPTEEPRLDEALAQGVYGVSIASGAVTTYSLPDSGPLTQEMVETPYCKAFGVPNGCGPLLAGASADGSRVYFLTDVKLSTALGTPQDTTEFANQVYERTAGHTYLVSLLPGDSVPACGASVPVGGNTSNLPGWFAPDGSNFVFGASDCSTSATYLRDVAGGTTVPLPGGFAGRAGTGPGEEEKLLLEGSGKLYEYGITSAQSTEVGAGELLTFSPDGSFVYYLGPEEGIHLWHEGATKLVPGTQAGGYKTAPTGIFIGGPGHGPEVQNRPVSTPDGSHLLFIDSTKLTGYENRSHLEAYVYDSQSETVRCISCNPAGTPAKGYAHLIATNNQDTAEQRFQNPSPPFISADGSRAVFGTTETLLPQDVNGTDDVYEWQREGTPGCTTSSPTYSTPDEGCLYLLSSGLGKEINGGNGVFNGTHLIGAAAGLQDVYIWSSEPLLPGEDNSVHIYDVRAGGGFPLPPPPIICEGEESCHGPAAAEPSAPGFGSEALQHGREEVKLTCRRGFVRRRGHCVKPKRHRRRAHHRARADRGVQR